MIELGDKQEYYNELFGEHIAETCDVAIVVGKYNHDAIMEGIKKKGMKAENVHETATFNEAQALMMKIAAVGDTVLYENDLPDTFK
jgi:UDP-N-acetylmuramoyl-tripeptide--D-alanyl-D-alanine ligase